MTFKSVKNTYPLKPLSVIGILLGKGSAVSKAGVLFDVINENKADEVSLASIEKLFLIILDISLIHLPKLVVDKKLNLVSYLLRLLDYKEQYLGAIIIRIPFSDNKISRAVFCECFENRNNAKLLTPSYNRKQINYLADRNEINFTDSSENDKKLKRS